MTRISDLIEKLEEIKAKEGDLMVQLNTSWGRSDNFDVDVVERWVTYNSRGKLALIQYGC